MDASAFTFKFVEEARDRLRSLSTALVSLEDAPGSADLLADIFREAHNLKGSAQMLGFADISTIAHQLEELFVAAKRHARLMDGRAFDVVFRSLDVISARVEELALGIKPQIDTTDLCRGLAALTVTSEPEAAEGPVEPAPATIQAGPQAEAPPPAGQRPALGHSLRVTLEKLEGLTMLAPEMVLQSLKAAARHHELRREEAEMSRLRDRLREGRLAPPTKGRAEELGEYADALEAIRRRMRLLLTNFSDDRVRLTHITEELRQNVIELTMLPFSTVFEAFPRAVRDLARSFNKQVELTVEGRETELEKRVIEQVADPLMHLVRNAVDHGIEVPAERLRIGKPAAGAVLISARQHGNRIVVTVRDDGRGIDAAELRTAAVRKGIASADDLQGWTDQQLFELIFAPGFSTRVLTTDVSGRGVGMDVVRVVVDGLGGSVRVQSELGRGTTVILDLPLSLGLLHVVLVAVKDELFAIPTAPVRRILHLARESVTSLPQGGVVEVMGETVPLAALGTLLGLTPNGDPESGQTALVVEARGGRFAVLVNEVREEQELVFKELRGPLRDLPTLAGAALLGNGDIVPILDVQALFELAVRSVAVDAMGPSQRPPVEARPGRILVVEDSLAVGELQKVILVAAGFDAEIARDGVEALDRLRQGEWDLVMTDVDMPRMDGLVLTAQVRADSDLRDLPVMVVTSRDSAEHRRRGLEAGADAYVAKRDFDRGQILNLVRELIGRRRQQKMPAYPMPRLLGHRHD